MSNLPYLELRTYTACPRCGLLSLTPENKNAYYVKKSNRASPRKQCQSETCISIKAELKRQEAVRYGREWRQKLKHNEAKRKEYNKKGYMRIARMKNRRAIAAFNALLEETLVNG